MKKLYIFILLILTPVLLVEIFLHLDNNFYENILKYNYDFSEWQEAAPTMNEWKDTIIMGSSVAKQSIDPKVVEAKLNTDGIKSSVGTIAINAASTMNDYLTLKRILATCVKCPKTIIYQVTDLSLKDSEIKAWKENTMRRMLKLYFEDNQFIDTLAGTRKLDPYFNEYYLDLKFYNWFRLSFTKGRLLAFLENGLLKRFGIIKADNYEPNYADPNLINDGNGFYSYSKIMDKKTQKASLEYKSESLKSYKTGGATKVFFEKFVEFADKHNVKIYFVLTPEYVTHINFFKKEENTMMDLVNTVSKAYQIPVLDDRGFESNNIQNFYDLNHLNANGANKYSNYLGSQLTRFFNR